MAKRGVKVDEERVENVEMLVRIGIPNTIIASTLNSSSATITKDLRRLDIKRSRDTYEKKCRAFQRLSILYNRYPELTDSEKIEFDACYTMFDFKTVETKIAGAIEQQNLQRIPSVPTEMEGYIRLLFSVFGYKYYEAGSLPINYRKLISEYLEAHPSNEVPTDIVTSILLYQKQRNVEENRIPETNIFWSKANSEIIKKIIDETLRSLDNPASERMMELTVLQLRFGLEERERLDLKEVAEKMNITSMRVRQIEAKALRKLRHPHRNRHLKGLLGGHELVNVTIGDYHIEQERKNLEEKEQKKTDTVTVDDLELSIRSSNLLKRKRILTLSDILNCTYQNLCEIPNMGRKNADEIKQRIEDLGYTLKR